MIPYFGPKTNNMYKNNDQCIILKRLQNEDIKVECLLEEKITDEKIMIEQTTIQEKYDELLIIQAVKSKEEITCKSMEEVKEERLNIKISFRQISKFKPIPLFNLDDELKEIEEAYCTCYIKNDSKENRNQEIYS